MAGGDQDRRTRAPRYVLRLDRACRLERSSRGAQVQRLSRVGVALARPVAIGTKLPVIRPDQRSPCPLCGRFAGLAASLVPSRPPPQREFLRRTRPAGNGSGWFLDPPGCGPKRGFAPFGAQLRSKAGKKCRPMGTQAHHEAWTAKRHLRPPGGDAPQGAVTRRTPAGAWPTGSEGAGQWRCASG